MFIVFHTVILTPNCFVKLYFVLSPNCFVKLYFVLRDPYHLCYEGVLKKWPQPISGLGDHTKKKQNCQHRSSYTLVDTARITLRRSTNIYERRCYATTACSLCSLSRWTMVGFLCIDASPHFNARHIERNVLG